MNLTDAFKRFLQNILNRKKMGEQYIIREFPKVQILYDLMLYTIESKFLAKFSNIIPSEYRE
jgi:hypothetical protein